MYQWEEEQTDKTVTYKKVWKNHRVNSCRFQYQGGLSHDNPTFPVAGTCMKLAKVAVGDFVLSKKMLLGLFESRGGKERGCASLGHKAEEKLRYMR